MSRADTITKLIKQLAANTPDLEASAVIDNDGLMIASALGQDVDDDSVAAMSAALAIWCNSMRAMRLPSSVPCSSARISMFATDAQVGVRSMAGGSEVATGRGVGAGGLAFVSMLLMLLFSGRGRFRTGRPQAGRPRPR